MVTQEKYEKIKADFEKVVSAARKEGKVVLRASIPEPALTAIRQHWQELYGDIAIEQPAGHHSIELMARIKAEQESKNYVADVYRKEMLSSWSLKQAGYSQRIDYQNSLPALNDPSAAWNSPIYVDPEGYYFMGFEGYLEGIIINTNLVPPDKEPKSWDDLLDPYWKGKMLQDYPAGPRTGGHFYLAMKLYKGDTYLAKLLEQNTTISVPQGSEYRLPRIARGEYPLEVCADSTSYLLLPPGTPVKWIFPTDGALVSDYAFAILKGAPHPNAALLFANFLLTKQGQTDLALGVRWVARGDVPVLFPKFHDIKGKKLLRFDEKWYLANSQALYAEAEKQFENHPKVGSVAGVSNP